MAEILWNRQRPEYLWWRISLTLKCCCNCAYCAGEFRYRPSVKPVYRRRALSPRDWISICNKLDTGIVITGGEPFVYLGLLEILEGIEHEVRIYSNLGPVQGKDIERINARGRISVWATHHHGQPGALSTDAFARKVNLLLAGGTEVKVSMIATSAVHLCQLWLVKRRLRKEHGIRARISREAGAYDPWPGTQSEGPLRSVQCKTGCFRLVGPDGFRYPCQSKLVRAVGKMEDLLAEFPSPMDYSIRCDEFGLCLPCDRHGPRMIEAIQEG